ncbi:CBS domain-containing protein [Rhodohalobacter mucosus]|uniref:CBS domain-containing protein n=1 Tax=Rhodohalobacter mucosus TaxID=2079485 RepID=A0A316TPD6_9BACT|nr:CBS domain-containing protein [Rhodohalobacter mucosus]PWN06473.1 hypothetical protein DDZ15_08090 [Rhodohalobacter mucosus]
MKNSDRFISLFKKLEKLVAEQSQLPRDESFSKMLAEITRGNTVFRHYKEYIQQYAKLRNAIVHESVSDDKAIAEPHDEVLSRLEEIVKKIENPAKVIPKFQVKIESVKPGTMISDALDRFYKGNYSQLPVIEDGKFFDLLTTDAVARWIAAHKEKGGYLLENVAIREVLPYKEVQDNFSFISRRTTLLDVLEIFRKIDYKEQPLDALLITNDGKKEQKLMGIITHYDVSKIYSLI